MMEEKQGLRMDNANSKMFHNVNNNILFVLLLRIDILIRITMSKCIDVIFAILLVLL